LRVVILVLVFCLEFIGSVAAQAQPQPMTLAETMLLALKYNPALAAAGLAVETAEADLARARARFLPTVNFNESYNFSDNPSQVFMGKLNQRVFTGQDFILNNLNNPNAYGNFHTSLVMRQPLFQAGEAHLGYQQARIGREMAAAYVLSARQQLLFQVTQAYFGLQLAQENLAVVQQARHTAASHLKIAQTRFQAGTVVHSDVLSAQVHLAKVTQEEMTAASQVQIARSALATVVGQPEAGQIPLSFIRTFRE
jgi:outer membrane protein